MRDWRKGGGKAAIDRDIGRTAKAALFGEDDGLELLELGLGQVEPNPDQPRRLFPEGDLAALAESLRTTGQLQPIGVTRVPGTRPQRYRIAFGERRWRAAQIAGLERIRAVVLPDGADAALVALIENLQRADLSPIEEARAFRRLMDTKGFSQEELGKAIGRSITQINQTMALLRLHPVIQEALAEGIVAPPPRAVLLEIARIDAPEDQLALWRQVRQGGMTAVEARATRRGDTPAPVQRPRGRGIASAARTLTRLLDESGDQPLMLSEREALKSLRERIDVLLAVG